MGRESDAMLYVLLNFVATTGAFVLVVGGGYYFDTRWLHPIVAYRRNRRPYFAGRQDSS